MVLVSTNIYVERDSGVRASVKTAPKTFMLRCCEYQTVQQTAWFFFYLADLASYGMHVRKSAAKTYVAFVFVSQLFRLYFQDKLVRHVLGLENR